MLCEEKRLELDGLSWTMMDATTTFSERKVKGEEMQEVYLHAEVFQEARDQDDVWEVKRLVKSSWVWGKKAYGQVPVVGYGRGRVFWRNMVIFNCKSERLSPRGIYILRCGRGHTMASVCFFCLFFLQVPRCFFQSRLLEFHSLAISSISQAVLFNQRTRPSVDAVSSTSDFTKMLSLRCWETRRPRRGHGSLETAL